jgi:hypothetical protein
VDPLVTQQPLLALNHSVSQETRYLLVRYHKHILSTTGFLVALSSLLATTQWIHVELLGQLSDFDVESLFSYLVLGHIVSEFVDVVIANQGFVLHISDFDQRLNVLDIAYHPDCRFSCPMDT